MLEVNAAHRCHRPMSIALIEYRVVRIRW